MSCKKQVITTNDKFVFRNEVTIHHVGIWTNATDVVTLNFNQIGEYAGVLGNVPSGITIPNSINGFTWVPLDLIVKDFDFQVGLDTKAVVIVVFSEKD